MIVLLALLLAAGPVHRARAERAEALGHMREAAREYEAAFSESREPELLYRLGIVRRKLKQYPLAREAFRAYLRVAPEGGLREEVQRQLVKIEVLLEAQSEDFSEGDSAAAPRKPGGEQRSPAASAEVNGVHPPGGEQRSPAASAEVNGVHQLGGEQRSPAASAEVNGVHQPGGEQRSPAASAEVNGVHQPDPSTAPLVAAPPAPPVEQRSPASSAEVNGVHQLPPAALPGEQRSPALSKEVNAVHRAGPWLAGGAAIAAATGAYFWWDGARLSNALDTRFAQGGLQPRDQPLYGKSSAASIAGRALVAAGAALAVGAVIWW